LLFSLCAVSVAAPGDGYRLALEGNRLTAEQVAVQEASVQKNPNDLAARTRLLGYYFTRQDSPANQAARAKHILWIIQNNPEAEIAGIPYGQLDQFRDPIAYGKAKALWMKQVQAHPNDVAILSHAAGALEIFEPAEAEKLFKRCEQVDPGNADWPDRLANLYQREQIAPGADRKQLAARALVAQEHAAQLATDPREHFYEMTSLPNAAADAGDYPKAQRYARQLLEDAPLYPKDWNYGNAIFYANIALGRVELAAEHIDQANKYLLAAGKTPGSPQLDSFGPSFDLAAALLQRGQKQAVLKYLSEVSQFWHSNKLTDWKQEIEAGRVPDFSKS
jgi:tetratricopeptide (TPR) repeat protein